MRRAPDGLSLNPEEQRNRETVDQRRIVKDAVAEMTRLASTDREIETKKLQEIVKRIEAFSHSAQGDYPNIGDNYTALTLYKLVKEKDVGAAAFLENALRGSEALPDDVEDDEIESVFDALSA